jgi:hypothetical protein
VVSDSTLLDGRIVQAGCFPVTSSAIARLFVLIAFAIFCSPAMADAEIHKASPDGWIERVELPKPDPRFDNQIRNGISNILSEYQIRQPRRWTPMTSSRTSR